MQGAGQANDTEAWRHGQASTALESADWRLEDETGEAGTRTAGRKNAQLKRATERRARMGKPTQR
jgi:hypothetical protein